MYDPGLTTPEIAIVVEFKLTFVAVCVTVKVEGRSLQVFPLDPLFAFHIPDTETDTYEYYNDNVIFHTLLGGGCGCT